jgi:chaperonin GroEL (HSP60 family)
LEETVDPIKFMKDIDEQMKKGAEKVEFKSFECEFTDMKISNVGYGEGEYKTSKPNIVKNESVIKEILSVSEAAETAIGHTIGPYGDATLIQSYADRDVPVYNTRDGYTILQNMSYSQPIPNAIFKILKEVSDYLQIQIGDSTSSGIPIQNTLLTNFIDIFNKQSDGVWKFSPVGIKNISNICVQEIAKGIKDNKLYQKVFPKPDENGDYTKEQEDEIVEWLTKVATTSANNDYITGKTIANLYRNKLDGRGDVIVTTSQTEEEYVENVDAFRIPVGLFDEKTMANSADRFLWTAEKPLIAMFDGGLMETDLDGFKKIVQTVAFDLKRPLLVVASSYNMHIANYIYNCIVGTQYNALGQEINDPKSDPSSPNVRVNIAGIVVKNKHKIEEFLFEDIRIMTGAKVFSTSVTKLSDFSDDREVRKGQLQSMFGTCDMVTSGFADTNFAGCNPNKEEYDALVAELKKRQEAMKGIRFHNMDITFEDLDERINRLQGRTTFFYCGGNSQQSKYSRKLIVDDAVRSVGSAIKNGGVSLGGNMSISHYIHHNFDKLVDDVLNVINNTPINITAAENYDTLRNIVTVILETIKFSFGSAYRYALYNMYRNPSTALATWEHCVKSKEPIIYNIMTNVYEKFNDSDPKECTQLIVPRNTDTLLMGIITESVGQLINIGNMITLARPNLDFEAIQDERLKAFQHQ